MGYPSLEAGGSGKHQLGLDSERAGRLERTAIANDWNRSQKCYQHQTEHPPKSQRFRRRGSSPKRIAPSSEAILQLGSGRVSSSSTLETPSSYFGTVCSFVPVTVECDAISVAQYTRLSNPNVAAVLSLCSCYEKQKTWSVTSTPLPHLPIDEICPRGPHTLDLHGRSDIRSVTR